MSRRDALEVRTSGCGNKATKRSVIPMLSSLLLTTSLALFGSQDRPAYRDIVVLSREQAHVLQPAFVEDGHLWIKASDVQRVTGFLLKPEGLCAGQLCIPLPKEPAWTKSVGEDVYVDASAFGEHLGQAVVRSEDGGVWSLGPIPALKSPLLSGRAPDFELMDREGKSVRLSDFRGSKVLLLTWASW